MQKILDTSRGLVQRERRVGLWGVFKQRDTKNVRTVLLMMRLIMCERF